MRVLVDTAVLIFAVDTPERLSARANAVLKNPDTIHELSSISLTEIAVKVTLGKLAFSAESAQQAIEDLDLRILPFSARHAFRLFTLPAHHKDPFDRQLIAQALSEQIPVVSPDRRFRLYEGLRVIW